MAPKRKIRVTSIGANHKPRIELGKRKKQKFHLDHVKLPTLTTNGVVVVTGSGDVGQLGLGPDVLEKSKPTLVVLDNEIVDICAGGMHTVCLTKSGKVLTFGCNDEGALGRVTKEEDDTFTAGQVELQGKVIQITAGDSHTAALLSGGRVFAWGAFRDSHGSMGLSVNGNEPLPYEIMKRTGKNIVKIASGADHLVLLADDGEIWTCGCAEQGQIGRITKRGSDREETRLSLAKFLNPAPIQLNPYLKLHFDNIWATTYCTFAKVAEKDDIYVFGLNNYYQMGFSQMEPQYQPKESPEFSKFKWQLITGGPHHTLGLTMAGKVYAIGRKEYGRLGLGKNCDDATVLTEVKTLSGEVVVNVACGSSTSFAVSKKGKLYGWGMGSNGQLGNGDEADFFEPTHIEGKQLKDKQVVRVSSGGQHTVILGRTENNN